MSLLVLRITSPDQEIRIHAGMDHVLSAQLIEYYASGLANQAPLFFQIKNHPVKPVHGNVIGMNYYPLLFSSFPSSTVFLNNPLELCGEGSRWNSSTLFSISIRDRLGGTPVFSEIVLVLRVNDPPTSTFMTLTNFERSLRQN